MLRANVRLRFLKIDDGKEEKYWIPIIMALETNTELRGLGISYLSNSLVKALILSLKTNPDSGLRVIAAKEVESETHRKLLEASTRVRVMLISMG